MSASSRNELLPSAPDAPTGSQHRTVIMRHFRTGATIPARSEAEETAFWAQLEEREEGRFALEADHLFDSGYDWAA